VGTITSSPLLARIIPTQVDVRAEKTVDITYRSFEEVIAELRATGLSDAKIDMLLEDLRPSSAVVPLDDESNNKEMGSNVSSRCGRWDDECLMSQSATPASLAL